MNKKIKKKREKSCHICKEDNYNLLDVHRIEWGKTYSTNNTVVLCVNCHRKVHCNPPEIIIDRWHLSSNGRVLHYFVEGTEYFN